MDPNKARYARQTKARALDEIIADADVFLGLSAGGVLKEAMVAKMGGSPLILALANRSRRSCRRRQARATRRSGCDGPLGLPEPG